MRVSPKLTIATSFSLWICFGTIHPGAASVTHRKLGRKNVAQQQKKRSLRAVDTSISDVQDEDTPFWSRVLDESFSITDTCTISANTLCVALDGNNTPCEKIEYPSGQCAFSDNDLKQLTFRLKFAACEDSRNKQEPHSSTLFCEDGPRPLEASDSVKVTCEDSANSLLLFSMDNMSEGDKIDLKQGTDIALPEQVKCSIFSMNNVNQALQTFSVDTSGQMDLHLKDTYGSFELEACNDVSCLQQVKYEYIIANAESALSAATITKFTRIRNNKFIKNYLPALGISNSIAPGSSRSVFETSIIDICMDEDYTTRLEISAPIDGEDCSANSDYAFGIDVPCRVDVDIFCKAEDGTECSQLQGVFGKCHDNLGGSITSLAFQYKPENDCSDSRLTHTQADSAAVCIDYTALPTSPTSGVGILCFDATNVKALSTAPQLIFPNDVVEISVTNASNDDPVSLPDSIVCVIHEPEDFNTRYQEFSFDVSGTEDLYVKDVYGSLELVTCRNEEIGTELECLTKICYDYEVINIGTNTLNITSLQRTRNGLITDELFDELTPKTDGLLPGESAFVNDDKETIDLCVSASYTTNVRVTAVPASGRGGPTIVDSNFR